MKHALKSSKVPLNDSGFTLAEFLVVGAIFAIILAITVPRFFGEQDRAYLSVARADARSLSETVSFALLNVRDFGAQPARIILSGSNENQEVIIESSSPSQPPVAVNVRLTPEITLAEGPVNNIATSQTEYCLAVSYLGRVAYQTQEGLVESCAPGAPLLLPDETGTTGSGSFSTPPTFVESVGLTEKPWIQSAHGLDGWVTLSPGSKESALSVNGTSWIVSASLPAESDWSSVAYGAGKYLAVARSGDVLSAVSEDGQNWTGGVGLSNGEWGGVVYGNTEFVVVGTNSVASSGDGITWEEHDMPQGTWEHIAYGEGLYVALQSGNTNVAAYSADGITWSTATLPSTQRWSSVAFGDGQFVVVAEQAKAPGAISTNGSSWTPTADLPVGQSYGTVGYSNGMWVALANGSAFAYTSTDGLNWIPRAVANVGIWTGITPVNGVWVVTSESSTALVGV